MNTDYHAHETQYHKLRRQSGRNGWGTDDEKREQIELLEEILRHAPLAAGARILELGCGAAELAIHFAGRGYRVSGVDISPTAIEWGRENAAEAGADVALHCCDVRRLPIADASVELVLDACLMHCIIGDDRREALREVWRVLRPGGLFAGVTMCAPIREVLRREFEVIGACLCVNGQAMRYIGEIDDIMAELRECGFEVLATRQLEGAENDTLVYLARKPA